MLNAVTFKSLNIQIIQVFLSRAVREELLKADKNNVVESLSPNFNNH